MPYFYALLWLLVVHWIGDFLLQSDWMAINKSKSNEALTTHVVIYGLAISVGVIPIVIALGVDNRNAVGTWMLINAAVHWATDYVTSRITARLHEKHRHYFYVMIGVDQLIHYFTLALTMIWLLKP